ncbi:MAG: hypothetical protein GC161_01840 [Planctomycetaceae bacterium]|nr:hypothetical protein [Planctomycetaceae bacterium]
MLLAYVAESAWTPDEALACVVASNRVCDALRARGKLVAAAPLPPAASAASVRVRRGEVLVTAGPFAETVEQLGGFFLIDVASLDEAIAVAAEFPPAQRGTIEIRPVQPLDGVPDVRFDSPPLPGVTRYVLFCYDDAEQWEAAGPAALAAAQAEAAANMQQLASRGQYVAASPLHPVTTATSVRIRQGKRLVTDGPFAETHEFLGGYLMVDVRDLNAAVAIAAKHPGARLGTVEIRRLLDPTSASPV